MSNFIDLKIIFKNSKIIIALARDGQFDEHDARMLIESKPVQNFLHSKKFDELLPGDLNYDDLKAVLSGDILEVIAILLTFGVLVQKN